MNTRTILTSSFIFLVNFLLPCVYSYEDNTVPNRNKYFKVGNDWYETYSSTTGAPVEASKTKISFDTPSLLFPPGVTLAIDPTLTVPVINEDVFGIGSSFRLSFPINIALDKITLKYWDDIKNLDNEFVWGYAKSRIKRSFFSSGNNDTNSNTTFFTPLSLCQKLSLQKLAMFEKLESLMNSYNGNWGWNPNKISTGKYCVFRTICEIYHLPMTEEFGMFGDLLRELVRADRPTSEKCVENESMILEKYIEAQRNGEKGSCQKYHAKCEKSLFY